MPFLNKMLKDTPKLDDSLSTCIKSHFDVNCPSESKKCQTLI